MSASTATAPLEGEDLKAAWMDLKEGKGFLPLKIGADALGVPEAVLQNVLQSSGVVRLKNDIVGILKSAPRLGKIMGNLRNDCLVSLPVGEFSELNFDGDICRVRGGMIDAAFNLPRWSTAFGITEESRGATRRNLYFFDDCGDSAYKIILWSQDANDIFDELVEQFRGDSDADVVTAGSNREDWLSTEKYQEYQSISDGAAKHAETLFRGCVDQEINVEMFIPTRAASQTYRGPLRSMEARNDMEGWFDIIYPHFMTHVGISEVARCVLEADGSAQSSSVVLVDGADHVICKLSLTRALVRAICSQVHESCS